MLITIAAQVTNSLILPCPQAKNKMQAGEKEKKKKNLTLFNGN